MTIHHLTNFLNADARKQLIEDIATKVVPVAPFFTPTMKNGTTFRYAMTNCGELGWVSDRNGYRYTNSQPNGQPWPPMPASIIAVVEYLRLSGYIPASYRAESCLINKYLAGQSLGVHQDISEENTTAPIISISLATPGIFLLGGERRTDPTQEILLEPGDIFIMGWEDRLRFHGFKGIITGNKRINLTIRQFHR